VAPRGAAQASAVGVGRKPVCLSLRPRIPPGEGMAQGFPRFIHRQERVHDGVKARPGNMAVTGGAFGQGFY